MGILSFFKGKTQASSNKQDALWLGDEALHEYFKTGISGNESALRNMATLRCLSLISSAIGMLPISIIKNNDQKDVAKDHKAYNLLKVRPNGYQTPLEFKTYMQLNVLRHGNAYARVIWSLGRPIQMIPLKSKDVQPRLNNVFELVYDVMTSQGQITLSSKEILHIRDPITTDGIIGKSRVDLAKETLDIANNAQRAAARLFQQGMMAGGALISDKRLTDEQINRVRKSLVSQYSGANNSGKWMVLEDGLKAQQFTNTASDSQMLESRSHQIEEIGRAFGVPRPLLMLDETSWGSGISALMTLFYQFSLQYWITSWEQALERVLLSDAEKELFQIKINEKTLLRSTPEEQSEFFAKALGSGGHPAWMTQNEVRELLDMPAVVQDSADKLIHSVKGVGNESKDTAEIRSKGSGERKV